MDKNKYSSDMKKQINDLLLKMQTGENCIGETANELLNLFSVSQQRELLKKWWKYFDEESVAINCNNEEREEVINDFFNCG